MAPLDLGVAAAVLEQRGVGVTLLDIEALRIDSLEVRRRLRDLDPETLVLHAITPALPHALELAGHARASLKRLKRVILVGQHATVLPQTVLDEASPIDLCIRGEFELALADVITGAHSSAAGLAERRDGRLRISDEILEIHDLDALPLPTHARFRHSAYRVFHPTGVRARWRWGFLLSSRGCPYPCTYCSPTLRNSYGRRYRYRQTASVMEEIEILRSLGCNLLHFKDDVFTLHAGRVEALCAAIRRRDWRLNWTVQTRPDLVSLPLLREMKSAGCRTISFGVESGSPRVLERLNKRITVQQVRSAFRWAREAGLRTIGFFMLGNPQETEEDIRSTHRLMLDLRPDIIQVAFFTPYPGSNAYESAAPDNQALTELSHYNMPVNLSAVDTKTLRRWQKRFYLDLFLRTGFLGRYLIGEGLPILLNLDSYLDFARLSAGFLLRRAE